VSFAKGSTVRTTVEFLRRDGGAALVERVFESLPRDLADRLRGVEATAEVPFSEMVALWEAADEAIGDTDPGWVERAGAHSIESSGLQLYGGILRKSSPLEFLTQSVSLFRLYYHPGDMTVVEQDTGRAVLRLVGFDVPHRLFCRRQTGGLSQALSVTGGSQPEVRHVRCVIDGDAFCEWELRWR
jgi:hypothetical protein